MSCFKAFIRSNITQRLGFTNQIYVTIFAAINGNDYVPNSFLSTTKTLNWLRSMEESFPETSTDDNIVQLTVKAFLEKYVKHLESSECLADEISVEELEKKIWVALKIFRGFDKSTPILDKGIIAKIDPAEGVFFGFKTKWKTIAEWRACVQPQYKYLIDVSIEERQIYDKRNAVSIKNREKGGGDDEDEEHNKIKVINLPKPWMNAMGTPFREVKGFIVIIIAIYVFTN